MKTTIWSCRLKLVVQMSSFQVLKNVQVSTHHLSLMDSKKLRVITVYLLGITSIRAIAPEKSLKVLV